ncbi:protein farnesyltransferase/geranylgeranyltransferase, putative [Phytophthora infestans T30-4]|uniref:Protein farnesyltransferase/geranylgeranyltransferase type-1 subunit alpha n=2 Tax=Phytophthora infestans TaxID=4787 RepID=D0NGA3_PHYIT|nr:protein farnesyltransferase/geranylgeranyltransferase, putative [Phytophthora infestans T30-4]EEY57304.1 protein farnesyltransferase/geranylgeranyltransferase, putative [Phytophthora infestans T30-4]|eukprot:XP_002901914.1 protein farnesyltransferase/geranylgeranyltransferase, putative [Phytophthora infestans T30-4]
MAAIKTSAGQRAERIKQEAVKLSAEEAANQKVLQHYAKTVYFNDLWVSFLSKMAGLVALMSYMEVQRMRRSPRGISFVVGFEALSVLIGASTVLFIRRWFNPLLAFKVAFAFSLLQGFWYLASYSSRFMELPRQAGDLLAEQIPFGLIYFLVCWVSDRFMMRSQDIAKQTAEDMRAVLKGKAAEDPAWADVVKVPQDDGPNPIVSIAYSANFTDVMDCFRGVLKLNECSERTLALTLDVIDANPANYTVWYFRRRVLEALGSDLREELQFTADMAIQHPKNYQIWHHRREICTMLHDASEEKEFCALAIDGDSKNYHAWAHRQWVVKTFGLWDGELQFVDKMLLEDVRNNSAWNHRWFVLNNSSGLATTADRQREIDYALDKISIAVHNESPWNYLRGLVRGHEAAFAAQRLC